VPAYYGYLNYIGACNKAQKLVRHMPNGDTSGEDWQGIPD
jgi:hypothetical protein